MTFIAMELIRGEKLSDVLARGPIPPPRALTLVTESPKRWPARTRKASSIAI